MQMLNVELDLKSANLLEGRDDCQNLRAKQAGSYLWSPSPASPVCAFAQRQTIYFHAIKMDRTALVNTWCSEDVLAIS